MPPITAARAAASPIGATLLLLATLLGSVGCTQGLFHRYAIDPASPEGKTCVQKCELPKAQCRSRQESREKECGQIYAIAKSEFDLCVKSGAARCKAPYTCLGADLSICDQQYDDCFAACGGRIEQRLRAAGDRDGGQSAATAAATASVGGNPGTASAAAPTPKTAPAKMDPP
jgi:hypothetical protein